MQRAHKNTIQTGFENIALLLICGLRQWIRIDTAAIKMREILSEARAIRRRDISCVAPVG